ncbi:hypothetical protein V1264_017326 [Littorina saxatilis]|uniref:Reverse transcriptase domain-containing protein n=1 Tax=Littorina saxatilis TaxID=31220 RepID=A0AAN9BI14_9CAEN
MTENKLKLNSEKTEALLVGTRQKIASLTVTDLQLDDATVPFSPAVKSLGVFLDSTLSMQTHISFIINTCFFHLRCIASIRRYLTHEPVSSWLSPSSSVVWTTATPFWLASSPHPFMAYNESRTLLPG